MKKINWKLFNIALWLEIILAYILPFKKISDFHSQVGFPIPFISVYDTKIGVSPLTSMHLNPLGFLLNGLIIYFFILLLIKINKKLRRS